MIVVPGGVPVGASPTGQAASAGDGDGCPPLLKVSQALIGVVDAKHRHGVSARLPHVVDKTRKPLLSSHTGVGPVIAVVPVVAPFPAGQINEQSLRLDSVHEPLNGFKHLRIVVKHIPGPVPTVDRRHQRDVSCPTRYVVPGFPGDESVAPLHMHHLVTQDLFEGGAASNFPSWNGHTASHLRRELFKNQLHLESLWRAVQREPHFPHIGSKRAEVQELAAVCAEHYQRGI